jgi:hypothetical protein
MLPQVQIPEVFVELSALPAIGHTSYSASYLG